MRLMMTGLSVLVLACRTSSDDPGLNETAETAVADQTDSAQDSLSILLQALWTTKGSFVGRDFSGHRAAFRNLSTYADQSSANADTVVSRLVECMDRTELSEATSLGVPVSRGMMCYQALRWIAYYEAVDEHGELTGEWVGHVELNATPAEMKAAQDAWREVVRKHSYSLL
jgi:hypothetical protein